MQGGAARSTWEGRKNSDKSSWFFSRRKGEAVSLPGLLCVSLNESDKIRVIGGSAKAKAAAVGAVRAAADAGWPAGVKEEKQSKAGTGAFQLKLRGNPWWSHGNEALYSRSLLCHVCKQLLAAGLRPVASADVSSKYVSQDNGPDYPVDVHSWWVVEEPKPTLFGQATPFFYAQMPVVQGSVVRQLSGKALGAATAVAGIVVHAVEQVASPGRGAGKEPPAEI